MAYTVSKVLNSKPEALSTAADEAGAGATRIGEDITRGRRHLDDLADHWHGTASESAQKQGTDMLTDQAAYKDKLEKLKTALASGAEDLGAIKSDLQKAVDGAEQWWNVADDGSVTPGAVLTGYANLSTATWFQVENHRIAVEQNIRLILAKFEAADENSAAEVRKFGWA